MAEAVSNLHIRWIERAMDKRKSELGTCWSAGVACDVNTEAEVTVERRAGTSTVND